MTETQELKALPCWHCETTDTITTELDALTGYKWGYAACSCGARGPDVRTGYDGGAQAAWRVEAITAWNTRPREAELEAEVGRLREALEYVVNPLAYLRRQAEARGRELNGWAYSTVFDLSFVQSIAEDALSHPKGADDGC